MSYGASLPGFKKAPTADDNKVNTKNLDKWLYEVNMELQKSLKEAMDRIAILEEKQKENEEKIKNLEEEKEKNPIKRNSIDFWKNFDKETVFKVKKAVERETAQIMRKKATSSYLGCKNMKK